MNRIYRIVFNRTLGVLQVVSEHASTRGGSSTTRGSENHRRGLCVLNAAMLVVLAGMGLAAPMADAQAGSGGAGGAGNRGRCYYGSGGEGGTSASPNGANGGSYNLNGENCSSSNYDSGGGGGGAATSRTTGIGGTGGNGGQGSDGGAATVGGIGGNVGLIAVDGFSNSVASTGGDGANGQSRPGWGYGGGAGGGGGGFALLYAGTSAAANHAALTGGQGGNGGTGELDSNSGGGGGGGEGGGGILMTSAASLTNTASILGGRGGHGGTSNGSTYNNGGDGGGGGSGGSGVVATGGGSVINAQGASISGGAGGNGDNGGLDAGMGYGGNGGGGGFGMEMSNGQITNNGTIKGGSGGTAGNGGRGSGVAGVGGTGLSGSSLQVTNSGTIEGGLANGGAGARADAITFTGGTNLLELRAGSSIVGLVNASAGSSDTLRLGGNADSSFDSGLIGTQYLGFETFEKTGLSTWTLTGAGPGAPWVVREGTLSISDAASLGSASLSLANGGLRTTASVNVTVPLVLSGSGGSVQAQPGTTAALLGTISGSGGLTTTGTGTVALMGNNTYSGGTNLQRGVLSTSIDSNLGSGPIVLNGGTWQIAGNSYTTTTRSVSLAATSTIEVASETNSFTLGQNLDGTAGLTKTGAGRLVLTGNNTNTGLITVSAGALEGNSSSLRGNIANQATLVFAQGASGTYSGSVTGSGTLVKNGAGTLSLSGASSYTGGTVINAGTLYLTASSILGGITNNASLWFNQADDGLYAGNIHGSGQVIKSGSGVLSLTGSNSYTGGTVVSGGTLRGTTSSLGGNIENSGIVEFNQATSGTYAGAISGSGSLLKTGTGWLTLAGANSYTGGTTIAAGVLEGTTSTIQGAVLNNGLAVFNQATDGIFSGQISGAGSLEKRGMGRLVLTGSHSYTGLTTVSGGTLEIAGGRIAGNIRDNASVVWNQATDTVYAGQISGSGTVDKTGAGALTLTGAHTYTGGTRVLAGALIGDTSSLQGSITNDAVLAFNQSVDGIYAGSLAGTGRIRKTGAGALIANGNSRGFSGLTEVAQGRLIVGGTASQSSAALGGSVTVSTGAEVGGHGTIAGDLSLASGAKLSPGNSIGTLSVEGDLILGQGSILDFEFGTPAPGDVFAARGQGDSVIVTGDLTLNGARLDVSNAGGFGAGLYRLFSYGGSLNLTNGGIVAGNMPAGGYAIQYLIGDRQVNLYNLSNTTLQFWNADGQASPTRAGGGSGVWSNSAPMWTDADGSVTSVMNPRAGVAIFAGQSGTVSVDHTDGPVLSSGLQFASSGYRLVGDALTLVQDGDGNQPTIRVGDGSALGATFVTTIENEIVGSAGLVKTDLGTLVLQGNNTYTGDTRIAGGAIEIADNAALGAGSAGLWLDGGVLRIAGDQLASIQRDVHLGGNGGGIDVEDASHTFELDQALRGGGSFAKLGAGTLLLTGANDYTGGTRVTEGTLVGNTQSVQGNILNDARVVFDQVAAGRYAGDMTGTGSLIKTGSGVLQLTGANVYTGGTVVEDGTLEGDAGSLQGDITNNGTVNFMQVAAGEYAGAFSGTGLLVKAGAGTLRLSGTASHTGGTIVSEGALVGDTRSLQGLITNHAQLVFDQSTDDAFHGVITGSGSLLKLGAGTLALVGAQGYTGGTRVEAGTLSGDTHSIQGDILNNSRMVFRQQTDGTHDGTISGSGSLVKEGDGTLVLQGSNTYTGGTVVAAGTLQGTTDSIRGNVSNSGTLVFDQGSAGTYAGVMSGTGALIKRGTGAVTLSGLNVFEGGTWIEEGSLLGSASTVKGNVVNNATLVLHQEQAGILSDALSGSGQLIKTGAGSLTIRQAQAFSGLTDVQAGTLIVGDVDHPAAILGGGVTVKDGATLQGTGALDSLDLYGTLAPGNSIGTLRVLGDATLRDSSRLVIEVDASGSGDQLAVGGHATLQGGTVLTLADGVNWAPVTDYTIIKADGGITGQFEGVQSNLAFLNPSLLYGSNAITLSMMRNDVSFASVGRTANQRSTAAGVDSVGVGATYNRVVSLDRASAMDAFDMLSGEIHASARTVAMDDAARVRRALMQRWASTVSAPETQDGVWVSSWANWGITDSDGNAARTTHHGTGLMLGADIDLDGGATVGFAAGQSRSSVRVRDRGSDAQVEAQYAALYAMKPFGLFSLRGGLVAGRSEAEVNRLTGTLLGDERLRSKDDANVWQAFTELTYSANVAGAAVEPYLSVSAIQFDQDRYAEEGGAAALVGEENKSRLGAAALGLRSLWTTGSRFGTAFFVNIAYQHAWGDATPSVNQRFALGGSQFEVSGVPTVRSSGLGEIGFKSHLTDHVEIRGNYEGRFSNAFQDQGVRLTLTASF